MTVGMIVFTNKQNAKQIWKFLTIELS